MSQQAKDVIWETAREMVSALLKDRYHPALIDGKPCQEYVGVIMGPPHIQ